MAEQLTKALENLKSSEGSAKVDAFDALAKLIANPPKPPVFNIEPMREGLDNTTNTLKDMNDKLANLEKNMLEDEKKFLEYSENNARIFAEWYVDKYGKNYNCADALIEPLRQLYYDVYDRMSGKTSQAASDTFDPKTVKFMEFYYSTGYSEDFLLETIRDYMERD
jgi:hypothetical protein